MRWLDKLRGRSSETWADREMGPIAFGTLEHVRAVQPDLIGWIQPNSLWQSYAGLQLKNGVSQLDPDYDTPPDNNDVPYWQLQARIAPPQSTRYGGSASDPMGPVQVRNLTRLLNGDKPVQAGAMGTLYQPMPYGSYPYGTLPGSLPNAGNGPAQ